MAPPIDTDWKALDTLISLAIEMHQQQNEIKNTSDEPAVLKLALYSEGVAALIQKVAVDYRPRLRWLKAQAEEVEKLKEENARLRARLMEIEETAHRIAADGL